MRNLLKHSSFLFSIMSHLQKIMATVQLRFSRESLRKKCPHSELNWSAFFRIWTEYGEIQIISPYLVQMRELRIRTRVYNVLNESWCTFSSIKSMVIHLIWFFSILLLSMLFCEVFNSLVQFYIFLRNILLSCIKSIFTWFL